MKKHRTLFLALGMLVLFAAWTVALCFVDVQTIGPNGSAVGFASVNGYFHGLTGANMALYTLTDWLGLVPVAFGFGFAVLGVVQWIKRRSFIKVDFSILMLGVYYIIVLAAYLLFEEVVINYRPILISGYLEVSYPSSTTMLVMCVMPTARMQICLRVKRRPIKYLSAVLIDAFVAFMVIGRLISGVHWLSDIIGGVLLSTGLVLLYKYVVGRSLK